MILFVVDGSVKINCKVWEMMGSWKNMFIVFLSVPGMESLVIFQEHLWIIDRRPILTKYTNTQIQIYKYANTKIQRAWNHWWFFLGICELLIPRPILSSFRCQVSPDGVYFLLGRKRPELKNNWKVAWTFCLKISLKIVLKYRESL